MQNLLFTVSFCHFIEQTRNTYRLLETASRSETFQRRHYFQENNTRMSDTVGAYPLDGQAIAGKVAAALYRLVRQLFQLRSHKCLPFAMFSPGD